MDQDNTDHLVMRGLIIIFLIMGIVFFLLRLTQLVLAKVENIGYVY